MKKIVALLVAMTLISASIFAAPATSVLDETHSEKVVGAGNQEQTTIETVRAVDETADLFADVGAVALTDSEAAQAEGGYWAIVISALIFVAVVVITHL
jgi:hypothetical protein